MKIPDLTRRHALQSAGAGFGYLALQSLLAKSASAAAGGSTVLSPKQSHFPAKAKRVIFLFMRGGVSQVDSFDHKPELTKRHEEDLGGGRKYFQSPWEFTQHGECGLPVSSLFPHIAKHADDLCVVNSMHTDIGNHPQAILQMLTGSFQFVRPSVGSWVSYGLGTENQNLPGFVTMNPDFSAGGAQKHGSAFLPPATAGTVIGDGGVADGKGARPIKDSKIPYTNNPKYTTAEQRQQLDLLGALNRNQLAKDGHHERLESLIQSYELAFRMQSQMPELMDVERENPKTLERYGVNVEETDNIGRACLMARRMAEAGVRFIQINHGFWDHHTDIFEGHPRMAKNSDQPIGALLTDLKERGMLDDTLVVWTGEFGRPPILNKNKGRDHNNVGFSLWMAGGGAKGGLRYGETDPTGTTAEVDKVHLHDLHATMLHLLGLDHERLTYRHGGRDFRLTDVYGKVIQDLIG
ncbi:MAG: hypothetical protein ACI8UO_000849 [Verrucomicrobiales bacterium]|jgi:hypothetical protein